MRIVHTPTGPHECQCRQQQFDDRCRVLPNNDSHHKPCQNEREQAVPEGTEGLEEGDFSAEELCVECDDCAADSDNDEDCCEHRRSVDV